MDVTFSIVVDRHVLSSNLGLPAGVATQLFTQVINSARIARAARIFLHVLEGNTPALAFYRKQVPLIMHAGPGFVFCQMALYLR